MMQSTPLAPLAQRRRMYVSVTLPGCCWWKWMARVAHLLVGKKMLLTTFGSHISEHGCLHLVRLRRGRQAPNDWAGVER